MTAFAGALIAAWATASPARAQSWISIETDRFTVVSELDENATRGWTAQFNRFVDAVDDALPLTENEPPPLTAVLFSSSESFSPYWPRGDSEAIPVNGLFVNHMTWSVIGMNASGAALDSTTYHEAVHWFMSADPTRYPRWVLEGIAEVFASFEIADGMLTWGRPSAENLETIDADGLIPMTEFLGLTPEDASTEMSHYYSQAWLLVHYMLFGSPETGADLLERFVGHSETLNPRDALVATLGMELDALDDVLAAYAERDEFDAGQSAIDNVGVLELAVRPAPEDLVEVSLARLAFGARNDELVEHHLERAFDISVRNLEALELWSEWQRRMTEEDAEINP